MRSHFVWAHLPVRSNTFLPHAVGHVTRTGYITITTCPTEKISLTKPRFSRSGSASEAVMLWENCRLIGAGLSSGPLAGAALQTLQILAPFT